MIRRKTKHDEVFQEKKINEEKYEKVGIGWVDVKKRHLRILVLFEYENITMITYVIINGVIIIISTSTSTSTSTSNSNSTSTSNSNSNSNSNTILKL